ncbi:MAG: hypothetical protein SFY96_05090 [Planctomycetota bacterium]|nr:hypothetical protein [Planctomycetota bacterium]
MNKKSVCAVLLAFAGSASLAWATPKAYLEVYDGAAWRKSVGVVAGSTVQVRYMVDWTGTTAYGLNGVLTKFQLDGVESSDEIPGRENTSPVRSTPFDYGGGGLVGAQGSGASYRVGQPGPGGTIGFLNFSQQPPNVSTNFTTARVVQLGAWTVKMSASRALGSSMSLSALVSQTQGTGTGDPTNAFAFYDSVSSSATSFRESGIVEGATIIIVPTPSTLMIPAIAMGAGMVRRRRMS